MAGERTITLSWREYFLLDSIGRIFPEMVVSVSTHRMIVNLHADSLCSLLTDDYQSRQKALRSSWDGAVAVYKGSRIAVDSTMGGCTAGIKEHGVPHAVTMTVLSLPTGIFPAVSFVTLNVIPKTALHPS